MAFGGDSTRRGERAGVMFGDVRRNATSGADALSDCKLVCTGFFKASSVALRLDGGDTPLELGEFSTSCSTSVAHGRHSLDSVAPRQLQAETR